MKAKDTQCLLTRNKDDHKKKKRALKDLGKSMQGKKHQSDYRASLPPSIFSLAQGILILPPARIQSSAATELSSATSGDRKLSGMDH